MGVVVATDHVFSDLSTEQRLLGDAGHELRYDGDVGPERLGEALREADAVLNCYLNIPAGIVEGLDRCRIISRYGIGLDTIPVDAATARGILVTNVPDYCIDEVSDHALALILAVARGVVRLNASVSAGSWSPVDARPLHRL